ncbi:MAG: DUF7482 domain-containing protein [Gemmatimonadota bacterium]
MSSLLVALLGAAACSSGDSRTEVTEQTAEPEPASGMVMDMAVEGAPEVPPVRGFAAGEEILFLHTEVSDSTIATTLTDMMGGSPVLHVPELAQAGGALLADVYVFTNGLQPDTQGPLGYQADVFDCPPGEACYRPLRRVNLVTWADPSTARLLRSADDVKTAIDAGELAVERPGIVVNMPMIRWPGGQR